MNPILVPAFSLFPVLLGVLLLLLPSTAQSTILLADTVWEGEVRLEENILVPEGVTLTVRAGAVISVIPADNTRTDPEYMSSLTEITVRGTLNVEGTPGAPVLFRLDPEGAAGNQWAGIIVHGGVVRMRSCTVRDAETGIWVLGGTVQVQASSLTANHYGLVAHRRETSVMLADTRITGNEYGLLTLSGAAVLPDSGSVISGNRKEDVLSPPVGTVALPHPRYEVPTTGKIREVGDEVIQGDAVWQGHLRVNGLVRVPSGSRLIILPGTLVEFSRKDSNGDGIGENGLMLQGVLLAKGTEQEPIFFRSAEEQPRPGDWDAVNIINSDGARNLIEYCQFEDAYRGLHFHFANVLVQQSVFRNSYRGVQFQESTVELRHNLFRENISAIQARDSEILFRDNQVLDNIFGANFYRAHLTIEENRFASNLDFGLKVREGYPTVARNIFDHNRFGLMLSDTSYGSVAGNLMVENSESGMSVRKGINLEVNNNFVQGNGLSGISLRDSTALVRGNHISEQGERGVGVISFQGQVTGNSFSNNRLYAIAAEDGADVAAPGNWYDRADIDQILFDINDDPSRGRIDYGPVAEEPVPFAWPLDTIPVDVRWTGGISVPKPIAVPKGTTLTVAPGADVLFARDGGLAIQGRLLALGGKEKRIRFTATEGKEPGSWGEILLEYAEGSRFANCDVEYATWGIHSHFTAMPVVGCTFRNNGGGLRFRSGPLVIRNSLFQDNDIGIRAYLGRAEISTNIITGNNKGIFVREQGGGLQIRENNIFGNRDYNIRVGDFNREDIQATGNWWGTDDPAETIFDARREPGIGTVLYDPPLRQPLEITIVDSEQQ
ncbi:MAG: right-handed parallel beta-helix repeat-containing protein [Desulfobulbaceae bacterium]